MEGGHTVYAAVGDLFGYLCLVAMLALWQFWPRGLAWRRKMTGRKT